MRQRLIGGSPDDLHTSTTQYNSIISGDNWSSAAYTGFVIPTACTFNDLYMELTGSPGSGKSYVFALDVNGAPSALTCTIADDDTIGSDIVNSVSLSPGDVVRLQSVPSGTPTVRDALWGMTFTGDTAKESILGFFALFVNSQTRYIGLSGRQASSPLENKHAQPTPTSGVLKKLYVDLYTAPGTGAEAYKFTLMVNGVPSALTCTVTGTAKTANDTANEVTVAFDDLVSLKCEPLNSPTNSPFVRGGIVFVADTDGESIILGGISSTPSGTVTNYNTIGRSNQVWGTTEVSMRQFGSNSFSLSKLTVYVVSKPGGNSSWDITTRKNEASTLITVNVAGTDNTGNDLTNTATYSQGDYVTMMIVPTNTPTQTLDGIHWGIVSVLPGSTYPSDPLTRVTEIVHRYTSAPNVPSNKILTMELLLGGATQQSLTVLALHPPTQPELTSTPDSVVPPSAIPPPPVPLPPGQAPIVAEPVFLGWDPENGQEMWLMPDGTIEFRDPDESRAGAGGGAGPARVI